MVNRGDIIWLGVSAGVTGGIIGGSMLGLGVGLAATGHPLGFLLLSVGGPGSGLIGWLLARRLAQKLDTPE